MFAGAPTGGCAAATLFRVLPSTNRPTAQTQLRCPQRNLWPLRFVAQRTLRGFGRDHEADADLAAVAATALGGSRT